MKEPRPDARRRDRELAPTRREQPHCIQRRTEHSTQIVDMMDNPVPPSFLLLYPFPPFDQSKPPDANKERPDQGTEVKLPRMRDSPHPA